MTSNVRDLDKALLQGVVDCALGMPIAQQNADFDKPTGAPWAAVFINSNQPSVVTLGDGGEDAHDGILQIDLNYPLGSGTAATADMIAQIVTFFKAGKRLLYNDTLVHVSSAGKPRSRDIDGWWCTSLTIVWYARIAR